MHVMSSISMTRIKSNQRRDAYHLGKASLPVIIFIKALSWWNLKVTVIQPLTVVASIVFGRVWMVSFNYRV